MNKVQDEVEDEKLQKIKEEFHGEPETVKLRINRVPKYVSDDLKDEANEYFGGDYGMALTFWHREQKSLKIMEERLDSMKKRINSLESLLTKALNNEEDDNDDEGLETLN